MPTNPDLAALSAAATPGEWRFDGDWHRRPCIHASGSEVAQVAKMGFPRRDYRTPDQEANAAFIVGLVNAYRTGNLIQIDREGMRALHERIVSRPHDAPMHIEHLLDDAADAIAAILGVSDERL